MDSSPDPSLGVSLEEEDKFESAEESGEPSDGLDRGSESANLMEAASVGSIGQATG